MQRNHQENMIAKDQSTVRPQLVVRKIDFNLKDGINPVWNPKRPEWSHMVNGASLTMPYLEPFLIRSMSEGLKLISDDQLRDDVRKFNAQEGQHFQHHRRYNDMLKAKGYPELGEVEQLMAADYARFQNKSLKWKLAYAAGFETMTVGITEWLVNDRQFLFGGADQNVSSFVLWHMVEETEHKNVAIDLYNHLYRKDYFARIKGILIASLHVVKYSRKAYIRMLKNDGLWKKLSSRKALWKMVVRFGLKVSPIMFKSLAPNYHPSKIKDPEWVQKWIDSYNDLPADLVPILDTRDPQIPPLFT
jgi:predicted metal-dependent hydrolase